MLDAYRRLPQAARQAILGAGLIVAAVVFLAVLPKSAPSGVLVFGAVGGCINALLAGGIILVYRSSRIINFAQPALGGVCAGLIFNFVIILNWPFLLALPLGLLVATLFGALVDLLFVRRFFTAPRLVLTVVTVVLTQVLGPARGLVDMPFRSQLAERRVREALTRGTIPLPFEDLSIEVFPFRFGFGAIFTVLLTIAAFAALGLFFRYSTLGASIRGAAENSDRALLLGINVKLLSTMVWAIAGALSGLAAVGTGMTLTFQGAGSGNPETLVPALAAAVIGRMRSLPVTIATAVAISVLQQAVFWSFPKTTVLDIVLLGVIAIGLVLQRRKIQRSEEGASSSWEATKENRPTPKEMLTVPGLRRARRAIVAALMIAVVVFPLATSPSQTNLAALIAINAIVALSLVVLTGWGGQVSLGQFAFVAVAAVVGGKLTSDWSIPFWIVLPLVSALTAGFATLVGMPALRIRGMFLAVTTLAFSVAVQRVLFNDAYFGWLLPDRVERPRLFFLTFGSERNYYYLCVACALVAAIVVKRLRASRPGRVLIALREDEKGIQTFGINATRTRLAAFALSGALAGFAGVLYAHHQRAVDAASYGAGESIDMFVMAMIGGITSVTGALLGAAYIGIVDFLIPDPVFRQLSSGFGLLFLLFLSPGGLAAVVYRVRDAVLRIVAMRRQMVVPSLFQDFDPDAIARRKWHLAERIPGQGLERLPAERRYAIRSELYPAAMPLAKVGEGP